MVLGLWSNIIQICQYIKCVHHLASAFLIYYVCRMDLDLDVTNASLDTCLKTEKYDPQFTQIMFYQLINE